MKIPAINNAIKLNDKTLIKNTRNPIDLYRMMKMYSQERKENIPFLRALLYSLDSIRYNCKMRIIKDDFGGILASYTYRFRKNSLDQKSMFIDVLVRNFKSLESKNLMGFIYRDMKNIAEKKNVQELTLLSAASDFALRKKYEKLGFKKDESIDIYKGYVMRTKIEDFLKNH